MKKILRHIGIDRAISYVLLGKGISFLSQPITLYLIAQYLTGAEQGYYYAFGSIYSASIFLELGLGMILTQFASHEFASLHWESNGLLAGDEISLSRLLSLIKRSARWYAMLAVLVAVLFIPGGILFLKSNSSNLEIDFILPWVMLVLFNSLTLVLYPFLSILEGCGRIADMQKLKVSQLGLGALFVWVVIVGHGTLFAVSSLAITNFAIVLYWIGKKYRGVLTQVNTDRYRSSRHQISWKRELLPLQWKIGISWMCGYLVTQLCIPLIFKYQNPTMAGQMGMSLNVANIVFNTGIVWVSTKVPLYGTYIRNRDYESLDRLASRNTTLAFIFMVFSSVAVLVATLYLKAYYPHIGTRLLSFGALAALLGSNIINLITSSMAGYMRAHKKEPFLVSSMLYAAVATVSVWITTKYFTGEMVAYAMALTNLGVSLPITTYIFFMKRRSWHESFDAVSK